jgi:hypothetical protein
MCNAFETSVTKQLPTLCSHPGLRRPAGHQRRLLHALHLEQERKLHGNLLEAVKPPALAAAGSEGGGGRGPVNVNK